METPQSVPENEQPLGETEPAVSVSSVRHTRIRRHGPP